MHIKDLLSSDPKVWKEFLSMFQNGYDQFSSSLGNSLSEQEIMQLLQYMMISIARNGFLTQERKTKLFKECEKMGIHILPVHFYNPVPNTSELTDKDFQPYETVGIELNVEKQWELLQEWSSSYFAQELSDIPVEKTSDHGEYYFNNPALCGIDAMIYYSFIRHFRPKRVIEVGAGYSTMIAAKATQKNETTELIVIDPYLLDPIEKGFRGLSQVIHKKVQDVEFSVFEKLEKNDILFVDNSHVSRIGSDVNHVILRILPILKNGVIVHFHDIFIPHEFPKNFVMDNLLFWNEQYLLQSFLLFNSHYEVLMSNYHLSQFDLEKLKRLIPTTPHYHGGSFWIRKTN